ncbi:hypothetical protein SKAU_G00140810 [Synaphobranchus kaupii]|uniref:Uncharacterized protein n=1 Tax=Synaphobranchus kaupii TaxID=118154 RepID=A0A9Q1FT43_SYNKA|nr:hypothetical protein SKAU_G00140810 [Synaphobranchus kaupii]
MGRGRGSSPANNREKPAESIADTRAARAARAAANRKTSWRRAIAKYGSKDPREATDLHGGLARICTRQSCRQWVVTSHGREGGNRWAEKWFSHESRGLGNSDKSGRSELMMGYGMGVFGKLRWVGTRIPGITVTNTRYQNLCSPHASSLNQTPAHSLHKA